ncbi:hypothetical protein AVEN_229441-1 [Araneus ventricosus]|uniref:Uncharacterized protein n=1 Tax=Araneus ventricosus TaxID=182803 RepID=A0A4Y2I652_ARAVE|nr:hypothetical protein AVEN_229441-1 [Araneus ventricosus]
MIINLNLHARSGLRSFQASENNLFDNVSVYIRSRLYKGYYPENTREVYPSKLKETGMDFFLAFNNCEPGKKGQFKAPFNTKLSYQGTLSHSGYFYEPLFRIYLWSIGWTSYYKHEVKLGSKVCVLQLKVSL